jgi:hypothetical protein
MLLCTYMDFFTSNMFQNTILYCIELLKMDILVLYCFIVMKELFIWKFYSLIKTSLIMCFFSCFLGV